MPCYCDTPSEYDQKEIEQRSKIRMYFDAISSMTPSQIIESEKEKLKSLPGFGDKMINENLCRICKILTKEQMENISAFYYQIKWNHKSLYDWYLKHLEDDKKHNGEKK